MMGVITFIVEMVWNVIFFFYTNTGNATTLIFHYSSSRLLFIYVRGLKCVSSLHFASNIRQGRVQICGSSPPVSYWGDFSSLPDLETQQEVGKYFLFVESSHQNSRPYWKISPSHHLLPYDNPSSLYPHGRMMSNSGVFPQSGATAIHGNQLQDAAVCRRYTSTCVNVRLSRDVQPWTQTACMHMCVYITTGVYHIF